MSINYNELLAAKARMTPELQLSDFVSANVGENGAYANVNEYIRDLVRRDKERWERQAFDRLKAELELAFATPDASFHPLSASDVTARNKAPL